MGFTDDDDDAAPDPTRLGPPTDQVPGVVPVEVVLGRSSDVAVLLTGMRAFPDGVAMVLGVRLRQRVAGVDVEAWDDMFDHGHPEPGDSRWQEARLRWGFTFADGAGVSNLEAHPGGISLHGGGGSGSDQGCDRDYWLSPLPPAGPIQVFSEWPRAGLPLAVSIIDALPILEAAARSRALWPEPASPRSRRR